MIYQEIDGIRFKMGKQFDFGFLKKYGKVFQVYDDQDSGNGRYLRQLFRFLRKRQVRSDVTGIQASQNLKSTGLKRFRNIQSYRRI